jgi:hypothetical protein
MKKWFESKTVWIGLMTFILSTLTLLEGQDWIQNYPNAVSAVGIIIGILTIVVRYLTQDSMLLRTQLRRRSTFRRR